MPVSQKRELKTVSVVLTKEQVRRLHERKDGQSSDIRRITFADVCREVVEVGLDALSREQDMIIHTSNSLEREVA